MKRSSKYVGLDVHQATTVTTVRAESGRVVARGVVPTEAAALIDYCESRSGNKRISGSNDCVTNLSGACIGKGLPQHRSNTRDEWRAETGSANEVDIRCCPISLAKVADAYCYNVR